MSEPTFDHALDDAMMAAFDEAQATFGHFWRELYWERRRIVPAHEVAAVKIAFADPDDPDTIEQMWINDVHYDGNSVYGVLMNSPNVLTSVAQGDPVQLPFDRVTDWLLVLVGEVYGGFTIAAMRADMDDEARAAHDSAWGLDFPDAAKLPYAGEDDHPLSVNSAPSLREWLEGNPEERDVTDDAGWTLLHHFAMAGSLAAVDVLLDAGANPLVKNAFEETPRDLAVRLGWERVAERLSQPQA